MILSPVPPAVTGPPASGADEDSSEEVYEPIPPPPTPNGMSTSSGSGKSAKSDVSMGYVFGIVAGILLMLVGVIAAAVLFVLRGRRTRRTFGEPRGTAMQALV